MIFVESYDYVIHSTVVHKRSTVRSRSCCRYLRQALKQGHTSVGLGARAWPAGNARRRLGTSPSCKRVAMSCLNHLPRGIRQPIQRPQRLPFRAPCRLSSGRALGGCERVNEGIDVCGMSPSSTRRTEHVRGGIQYIDAPHPNDQKDLHGSGRVTNDASPLSRRPPRSLPTIRPCSVPETVARTRPLPRLAQSLSLIDHIVPTTPSVNPQSTSLLRYRAASSERSSSPTGRLTCGEKGNPP